MAKKIVSNKKVAKPAPSAQKPAAKTKPAAAKAAAPKKKPAAAKKAVPGSQAAGKKEPVGKAPARKKPIPLEKVPAKKAPSGKVPVKKVASGKAASVPEKPSASHTGKKPPADKPGTPAVPKKSSAAATAKPAEKKGESRAAITASPVPRADRKRASQVCFTMDDVRAFLLEQAKENVQKEKEAGRVESATRAARDKAAKAAAAARPKQVFGAASIADILGFDPTKKTRKKAEVEFGEKDVPKKFLPYYKALMNIRAELAEGLERHSKETLLRSNREESGDLASFGQHLGDASSESYERDFALSQVSSEQEALYEIDQAIQRIKDGSYGVCEITGQPIKVDRLKAVPFTRYSVEGQMEVEKNRRRSSQRTGLFSSEAEDGALFTSEDFEE